MEVIDTTVINLAMFILHLDPSTAEIGFKATADK